MAAGRGFAGADAAEGVPGPAAERAGAKSAAAGEAPALVHRRDWRPPDWQVETVELVFALDFERTRVMARLLARRRGRHARPLVLDGAGLVTRRVVLDGCDLPPPPPSATRLELAPAGDAAVVETEVEISPAANRALLGLHVAGGLIVSQCEAEGFRRITWFPDRPDVTARFSVRLEADRDRLPVLLSNGNPGASGSLPGGRHFAEWHDPWPKPCYLFAVVGGRLEAIETVHMTDAGRPILLRLWAPPGEAARGVHALSALGRAIAFDETHFGRAPDLDCHQLVAVRDFAFGAMENKGLNIFNARYLLADPDTATDRELAQVAAVVAHEYLHNWSGNRVAIRDWFQLALKEGLTVWRDQCFQAAETSPALARLRQVEALEGAQFAEDAGPLAHSVRPDSYRSVQNFYTATVYAKGAEIIGMIARVLGPRRMRAALDSFFARHDGVPATIEDFLAAMGEAGLDAARFSRWYDEPGSPVVRARLLRREGEATLLLAQSNPRGRPDSPPLPIPLDIALWSPDGRLLAGPRLHLMTEAEEAVPFAAIRGPAIASVNRGFSAPVRIAPRPGARALAVLARHETDAVARRQAIDALAELAIEARLGGGRARREEEALAEALADLLDAAADDPELAAELLRLPAEDRLLSAFYRPDPAAIAAARDALAAALAEALQDRLRAARRLAADAEAVPDPRGRGLRALGNAALALLLERDDPQAAAEALRQVEEAQTMTLRLGGLAALVHREGPERTRALALFRARHAAIPEAIERWLAVQAGARRAETVEEVARLASGPEPGCSRASRVLALFRSLGQNPRALFRADGAGIRLLAEAAASADTDQPMLASGLLRPLGRWRRLAPAVGLMARDSLEALAARPGLSPQLRQTAKVLLA